jgi:LuxR family maltose regulon positive regulatory protein
VTVPPDVRATRRDPRLRVPTLREGAVPRAQLVARLRNTGDVPLVSVLAPGGYGKTTALAQWAATDPLPVAWLTLDRSDEDPFRLAADLAAALGEAGVLTVPRGFARARPSSAFWSTLVPSFRSLVGSTDAPFVLVLDDVQHAASQESCDLVAIVAGVLPPGCRLVLCGRAEVTAVVAPARARREVVEVGVPDLRLTLAEARALLADVGIEADDGLADALNQRAEGWAAGLALSGLTRRLAGGADVAPAPSSLDRFVEDYLRTQHLSAVSKEELAFLLETSVLERLTPALCDAVRGRTDARLRLEQLEAASRFVEALDDEREWFRYHELFRAALLRELERTDGSAPARLRLRAATWCAQAGEIADAIGYALAAGEHDLAARLVAGNAIVLWRQGHQTPLMRWLDELDRPEVLDANPALAVLGALGFAFGGDRFQAERWADGARLRVDALPESAPGVEQLRAMQAFLESMLCRSGPPAMLADAVTAEESLAETHPLYAAAILAQGVALALHERHQEACARLGDAVVAGEGDAGNQAAIGARAWLALLALQDGDLDRADALLGEAETLHEIDRLQGYIAPLLLRAVRAHHDALAGRTEPAAATLAALQGERPVLLGALPWLSATALVEMAEAALVLGDAAGARAVLVDAAEVLRRRPGPGLLADRVAALRARASGGDADAGATTLTAAELRLLPLLTTHLTFREIGERLFVSRNTVKTQAISIYRKLGASSRGEAVARATELGLVDAPLRASRFTPSG